MSEACPLVAGEAALSESEMHYSSSHCARVCVLRAMETVEPEISGDPDCEHDIVHGHSYLESLGGRQRLYTDQSVCLVDGEVVLVEEYSFKCIEAPFELAEGNLSSIEKRN